MARRYTEVGRRKLQRVAPMLIMAIVVGAASWGLLVFLGFGLRPISPVATKIRTISPVAKKFRPNKRSHSGENALIFEDGFESGDFIRWSVSPRRAPQEHSPDGLEPR